MNIIKCRSILLFILFIFNILFVSGQKCNITGRVVDEKGNSIEYGTVCILREDSVIAGCITKGDGTYLLNVSPGKYTLSVSYIGYNSFKYNIDISKNVNIPIIKLYNSSHNLKEVTVKASHAYVKREIDRIVFDPKAFSTVSTNVLDLLRNTPGVLVGNDESIQMVGKGKIVIMIDGRELKMEGKELSSYLSSYNSEGIAKIEVISVPPSKYSAEGDAGMINIILKKIRSDYVGGYASDLQCFTGNVANDYAGNLQYKHKNISSFFNLNGGFGNMKYKGHNTKYFTDGDWKNYYNQNVSNDYINLRTGMDFDLPKQYSVGGYLSYMHFSPDLSKKEETERLENMGESSSIINGKDSCNRVMKRLNANLHLDKAFGKDGGEMTFDVDYMGYWVNDNEGYYANSEPLFFYNNQLDRRINIYSSKLDFDMPFRRYEISYGVSFSRTVTTNNVKYLNQSITNNLNDHFAFTETISSLYIDLSSKLSKSLTGKLGVRAEYSNTDGNSQTKDQRTLRDKLNVFPTLYLNFSSNKNNVLNFAVSSRISRPSYSTLNPFLRYLDQYNIEQGNPYLKPEISYIVNLGYTLKNNFNATLSYRYTDDVIGKRIEINDKTKITSYLWDNYMKNQIILLDMSYNLLNFKWLESYIVNDIYNLKSQSDSYNSPINVSKWSDLIYINNSLFFNKKKTFIGQLSAQYQTQERMADRKSDGKYCVNMGIKYITPNGKFTVGAQIQNLLNSGSKGIIYSNNIQMHYFENELRMFRVSLVYRFGAKLQSKERKYSNSDLEDRL